MTGVTTSQLPASTYPAGYRIVIVAVNFSAPVTYSGAAPSLALQLDGAGRRTALYESGNGTSVLSFAYTVWRGEKAAKLDYAGRNALSAGGGVLDAGGVCLPT